VRRMVLVYMSDGYTCDDNNGFTDWVRARGGAAF
jgi:hypothetical protein